MAIIEKEQPDIAYFTRRVKFEESEAKPPTAGAVALKVHLPFFTPLSL